MHPYACTTEANYTQRSTCRYVAVEYKQTGRADQPAVNTPRRPSLHVGAAIEGTLYYPNSNSISNFKYLLEQICILNSLNYFVGLQGIQI